MGNLVMMSLRTLGTSPKKKRAKMPAEAPNPAATPPLVERLVSYLHAVRGMIRVFGGERFDQDALWLIVMRDHREPGDSAVYGALDGRERAIDTTYYLVSFPRLMPWKLGLVLYLRTQFSQPSLLCPAPHSVQFLFRSSFAKALGRRHILRTIR